MRVALIILDGWGSAPAWGGNAITAARTPTLAILSRGPSALLEASGTAVGLPAHTVGNSEVGHLNIGAGRIVEQESVRLTRMVQTGRFGLEPALKQLMSEVRQTGKTLHLAGLVSRAPVHADLRHAHALVAAASSAGVARVRVHLFLDGRDSDPRDGLAQVMQFEEALHTYPSSRIQTLCGRYFAMDRDQHWERTIKAYDLIRFGKGRSAKTAKAAMSQAYAKGETDEFLEPTVIETPDGPYQGIESGDSVLLWNFRADRARQLAELFAQRNEGVDVSVFSLCPYGAGSPLPGIRSIFEPGPIRSTLPAVLASHGFKQLHVAETEKYAHVTYFLNGRSEATLPYEVRRILASPTAQAHDQAPAMAAEAITQAIIHAITKEDYHFIVANFANADMIGHTGNFRSALLAVEVIDQALKRITEVARAKGVTLVITADHGNIEQMVSPITGEPATEHTANPVPCYIVHPEPLVMDRPRGILADVAPTILFFFGLPKPAEMTGTNLVRMR